MRNVFGSAARTDARGKCLPCAVAVEDCWCGRMVSLGQHMQSVAQTVPPLAHVREPRSVSSDCISLCWALRFFVRLARVSFLEQILVALFVLSYSMPSCRFPYMSCEIVCCEVPHILNAVANDNDSTAAPLSKLFSMLDEDGDMDAHRAGYLEKVRLWREYLFRGSRDRLTPLFFTKSALVSKEIRLHSLPVEYHRSLEMSLSCDK